MNGYLPFVPRNERDFFVLDRTKLDKSLFRPISHKLYHICFSHIAQISHVVYSDSEFHILSKRKCEKDLSAASGTRSTEAVREAVI
ncbi:MAG: hypothetical protein HFH75_16125 [Lachnospiraceae bacterium]|jgi:hypothetical protein|nr:hypothetical protein [Lachnospiraceae bacterium]